MKLPIGADLMKVLIEGVRAHALANYEKDGWDYVVECWSDEELAQEIGYCLTIPAAIKKVRRITKAIDDHRKEVQATAF